MSFVFFILLIHVLQIASNAKPPWYKRCIPSCWGCIGSSADSDGAFANNRSDSRALNPLVAQTVNVSAARDLSSRSASSPVAIAKQITNFTIKDQVVDNNHKKQTSRATLLILDGKHTIFDSVQFNKEIVQILKQNHVAFIASPNYNNTLNVIRPHLVDFIERMANLSSPHALDLMVYVNSGNMTKTDIDELSSVIKCIESCLDSKHAQIALYFEGNHSYKSDIRLSEFAQFYRYQHIMLVDHHGLNAWKFHDYKTADVLRRRKEQFIPIQISSFNLNINPHKLLIAIIYDPLNTLLTAIGFNIAAINSRFLNTDYTKRWIQIVADASISPLGLSLSHSKRNGEISIQTLNEEKEEEEHSIELSTNHSLQDHHHNYRTLSTRLDYQREMTVSECLNNMISNETKQSPHYNWSEFPVDGHSYCYAKGITCNDRHEIITLSITGIVDGLLNLFPIQTLQALYIMRNNGLHSFELPHFPELQILSISRNDILTTIHLQTYPNLKYLHINHNIALNAVTLQDYPESFQLDIGFNPKLTVISTCCGKILLYPL